MDCAQINGVELELRDNGSGEPVVFIHGGMGDECSAAVKEPALTDRYRVVDYHRRGWGNSERPERSLSIGEQAADCRSVMQHLGVERAHLVGQSYGGTILLQMALDHPDAVHTVALLEPGLPTVLFNSAQFGAEISKVESLYESGATEAAMEAFGQEVAGADYRKAFDQTMEPGYFERWVAEADTAFQFDLPAMQSWTFTSEEAARITVPVLNMRGANTQPYFREIYETVQKWLPHAETFVLPDATHAMLQMNPNGAAVRLAGFFASHPL